MRKIFLLLFFINVLIPQDKSTPADYWQSLSQPEKISFVNGVYAAMSTAKMHHQTEVTKQYKGQANWVPPYYIERYYEIIDEHISKEVGSNLELIAGHVDALYSSFDNHKIPLMEAIRIVSISQDGDRSKGNWLLLKAQKRFN
ncbi:MAG: hypothetical protein HQ509_04420 [Candidatus Marinimicrobia bacterium]|nr:hypothetical protein [Candidatus Neomarinimicrobiota bacterium]